MIAHSLPGRIRLRHPALRDPATLSRALEALRGLPGIERAEGSVATGSLLVRAEDPGVPGAVETALLKVLGTPAPARRPKPAPRSWHKAVKAGMGGLLGISLALAAAGRERGHVVAGCGFAGFLLMHLGLNRSRLIR